MSGADAEAILRPSPSNVTEGVGGKRKTFAGLFPVEWAFLVVSCVGTIAVIGLTFYRLHQVVTTNRESPDFTLSIVLIMNAVFCMYYILDGTLRERTFEIFAVIAATVLILVYCVVEYAVMVNARNDIKLARLIVACVLSPVVVILAALVARQFGWLEFKIVGASLRLQNMYREAARFISLLQFDLQISWSMVLLVLVQGTNLDVLEITVLAVGVPYSLFWMMSGLVLVRKELRWLAWIFALLGLAGPAYFLFKVIDLYINMVKLALSLKYITLVVGILGLLIRGIVYIELVLVCKNFGKGLKERAFPGAPPSSTRATPGGNTEEGA